MADLSEQVLRLLGLDNYWSGTNTFARTVGVLLERALAPLADRTDRLENIGGNLYFNGTLVVPSAGAGTVTLVGLTMPAVFSVAGSPVTSTGTLAVTLATQTANRVWAGPTSGGAATPTFRALVAADIPAIPGGGITGQVPVANGGTALASGTSGGILGFTASGVIASSVLLTNHAIVLGAGAGATPTPLASLGTATTVLHGAAAGAPTWSAIVLSTDVTGTLPVANGGTGLTTGTSGGILGFTAAGTLASSALLTNHALVLGRGAGATPVVLGSLGATTNVLHGNAAGDPSWGLLNLFTDTTGILAPTSGGTGFIDYVVGNLLYADSTTTLAKLAPSATATRYLSNTGTSNAPAWAAINLANGVTGTLPAANGGTSVTGVPTNGQTLIGNGTGYTLGTLTGTVNQVTVTNGAGTITLALPQSIGTADTPQFARIGLGTGAGATAVLTTTGQINLGIFDDGNSGSTKTINWNSGQVHKTTLTNNCTFTFSNPITGAITYEMQVTQDATGSRIVTWPVSVLWVGGAAPTLSTVPGSIDYVSFKWNGSGYLGSAQIGFA